MADSPASGGDYDRPQVAKTPARADFMPPLDVAGVPASLLERFAGDAAKKLVRLLRFLAPLTGGAAVRA